MTIEASNLSFRYGDKPVLREVSLDRKSVV